MRRSNELVGALLTALLLLISPTQRAAAAAEDPMHQVDQEFGKPNPNAPVAQLAAGQGAAEQGQANQLPLPWPAVASCKTPHGRTAFSII